MENLVINHNNESPVGNPEIKKMNAVQKAIGVLFSPSETMKSIAARPTVLFPIIMIAVVSFLYLFINMDLYKEYLMKTTEEMLLRMGQDPTPEMITQQAQIGSVAGLVSMPVMSIVAWLVGSVVLFAIVKILKGEGTFKQYLSVTGFAYVISVLSFILTTVVARFTGSFDMQSSVTSLASILPVDMSMGFIYGVLNSIELFTIWQYVVTGMGVMAVSKLSRKKTVYAICGVYLLTILYVAGSMAVGSAFTK